MGQNFLATEITIRYQGVEPGLPKRQTNPVKRDALEAGVVYWFTNFRAKHFTVAGGIEYGYQPRGGERMGTSAKDFWKSYTGRKLRRFGHRLPMVWTGESEMLTRIRNIKATSQSARWTNSARKLNFRPNPKAPNLPDELTRVAGREILRMARVYNKRFGEGLNRIKDERAVTP